MAQHAICENVKLCAAVCSEEVNGFSVRQLREFLGAAGIDTRSYFEKAEFLEQARALLKK